MIITRLSTCLFFVFIVLCSRINAQSGATSESGTTTYYHYASATGGTRLYLSEVVPVAFNRDYFPLTDATLKNNLKEQYLRFLQNNYGDSIQYKFSSYAMQTSKTAVEKARAKEMTIMKQKKYIIIPVKDFSYD